MSKSIQHPTTESLDRLRAGLLDESPVVKQEIEHHLANCATCRRQAGRWDDLVHVLDGTANNEAALAAELHARRRAALAGAATTPRQPWALPWPALATAAAVTLVLGLGIFLRLPSEITAPPTITQQAQIEPKADMFADIDFYVWLAEQEQAADPGKHDT